MVFLRAVDSENEVIEVRGMSVSHVNVNVVPEVIREDRTNWFDVEVYVFEYGVVIEGWLVGDCHRR